MGFHLTGAYFGGKAYITSILKKNHTMVYFQGRYILEIMKPGFVVARFRARKVTSFGDAVRISFVASCFMDSYEL